MFESLFDRQAVIDHIIQGNYPTNWRVIRVKPLTNYRSTLAAGIGTILCILFAAWWISVAVPGEAVFFFFVAILCFIATLVNAGFAVSRSRALLAILPEGVVKRRGSDISWLSFPEIASLTIAQETKVTDTRKSVWTTTRYWLDVTTDHGEYLKWPIEKYFGKSDVLCKTILAAYDHYQRHSRP